MGTPDPASKSFATTHWSLVIAAGGDDATEARAALARLCQAYWYPLYAFIRRGGKPPQDAEDLTQQFFVELLDHDWIARADRGKGRFRSFLLTMLKGFLANEWDKTARLKRGGHLRCVPLVMEDAEGRYTREPVETRTPEHEFERAWAITALEQALARVGQEYAARGQAALFEALKPSLAGSRPAQTYAELAAGLGMTEGAVKVAVSRLRKRFGERLRAEIAETVATPEEVASEVRHLFRVFARE